MHEGQVELSKETKRGKLVFCIHLLQLGRNQDEISYALYINVRRSIGLEFQITLISSSFPPELGIMVLFTNPDGEQRRNLRFFPIQNL